MLRTEPLLDAPARTGIPPHLLLLVAYELTVSARATYAMQSMTVERPTALRGMNEVLELPGFDGQGLK